MADVMSRDSFVNSVTKPLACYDRIHRTEVASSRDIRLRTSKGPQADRPFEDDVCSAQQHERHVRSHHVKRTSKSFAGTLHRSGDIDPARWITTLKAAFTRPVETRQAMTQRGRGEGSAELRLSPAGENVHGRA